jgi:uncharacterized membrane protein YbhN (UPF0104 family)
MTGRVWAWARVLGGAAIIGLLIWRLGSAAFLDGLRVINGWTLLIASAIGLLTTVFSAWRWRLVARGLGIRLAMRSALADYYQALFLNAALPGGVLGDVHRAVRHGKEVGDVGRGVRAVVLERTAGQAVLVLVGLAVLIIEPPAALSQVDVHIGPTVLVAVALAGAFFVAGAGWALRRPGAARWARAVRTFGTDARLGLLGQRNWPGITIASAVVLAGHLATFLVAARAAGLSAPMPILVPIMLLALLAMGLPVNIGGWGPREGVTAWAFAAAGLGAAHGLTIAVVYGVLAFVASLPGAGVLAYRWITGLPGDERRAARDRGSRGPHPAVDHALQPALATAPSSQATSHRADSA